MSAHQIQPLAQDYVVVTRSPDPQNLFCGSPGLALLPDGVILATMELYGGDAKADGRAFLSLDKGVTFSQTGQYPICHARPFTAGNSVYILGHNGDLTIIKSDDWGQTWGSPVKLTEGEQWHQAPSNVWYSGEYIYLVMEKRIHKDIYGWYVGEMAPILMRGRVTDDLTKRENWTFADAPAFCDIIHEDELDYFGVPFYKVPPKESIPVAPDRYCAPPGWLETNVVKIADPSHYWYDPSGKTFHLLMRAHTGLSNIGCLMKVTEQADGSMTTDFQTTPSGKKHFYLPLPGGQMKFHILYDEITKLYWLLSSQATDSMTRAELLPPTRYNLPDNERNRLMLSFSKNCVDWCFAGMVTIGDSDKSSRHYASMAIDGADLRILSRSGTPDSKTAHNVEMITFHTVENFRGLVY